jgi:hypothetical protein
VFVAILLAVLLWPHAPPQPPPPTRQDASVQPVPSVPPDEPDGDPVAAAGLDRLDTAALLARARTQLEQGLNSEDGRHLSFPDGDNAIDLFREVLKREPGNTVAAQGLGRIAQFYARGARTAFDHGLNNAADELVDKGLRAAPEDASLLKLKSDLKARLAAQGG